MNYIDFNSKSTSNIFELIIFCNNLIKKIKKCIKLYIKMLLSYFNKESDFFVRKISFVLPQFTIALIFIVLFSNSIKTAVYINGEKIGYISDTENIQSISENYNNLIEKTGADDIVTFDIANEYCLSGNTISSSDVCNNIAVKIYENYAEANGIYIDGVFTSAVYSNDDAKNTIAKIQSDLKNVTGYDVLIHNNIEIKKQFYEISEIKSTDYLYNLITGGDISIDKFQKTTLNENNNTINVYKLNNILFETFRYETIKEIYKFETVYIENSSLYDGSEVLDNDGKDGYNISNYKFTVFDGVDTNKEVVQTIENVNAIDKIIEIGTKDVSGSLKGIFSWPLPLDSNYSVSSPFGYRILRGKQNFHSGFDIAVCEGTSVLACDSGTVVRTGRDSSSGNYITILHPSGYKTSYLHLSKILVSEGQTVFKHDVIGKSGNTGDSTGPHLHLGVSDTNGNKVNPEPFLSKN